MVTIKVFKEKGELKVSQMEYLLAMQEVAWEDDYRQGDKIVFSIFHAKDCPALDDKKCKCKPFGCVFQEKKRAEVEEYWEKGGTTKTGELMRFVASAFTQDDSTVNEKEGEQLGGDK